MSVNKVILVGNVGKDPEIRHLDTGVAVANFYIGNLRNIYCQKWRKSNNNRMAQHCFVAWIAEVAEKYVTKGSVVY
jgi:single-strand DNA-binding protein